MNNLTKFILYLFVFIILLFFVTVNIDNYLINSYNYINYDNKFNTSLDLDSYHYEIQSQYNDLIKKGYDCKYFAYVWKEWGVYNGFSYDYVLVDGHVFTIFYDESKYCIGDNDNLECRHLV